MSQHDRVRDLFMAVVGLPTDERERYLDEHCHEPTIRREVEELLAHHEQGEGSGPVATLDIDNTDALTSPLSSPDRTLPFQRLGDFRLIREIGRGGMGAVYEALEDGLHRRVALKILTPGARMSASGLQRFQQEARLAAKLKHPAIVPVYRYGEVEGVYFIATELIEGTTLAREIAQSHHEARLPMWQTPRGAARLIAPIAGALNFAHEHNVLHRDVKPSNILIDERGHAYLTDFGLAKDLDADQLTRTGDLAGTYPYMSPEQALAHRVEVDHRTDVFSLGVVLYEMVAGRRPFRGETFHEVLRAISFEDPPSLTSVTSGIPREIEIICEKALEKRPEDRYASAGQLELDLHAFAARQPIQARPPGVVQRTRRFVRRRRVGISIAAIALLTLSGGLWWGRSSVPDPRIAVALRSSPPGAEVWARRFEATGVFSKAQRLGHTPLRAKLDAGLYRFTMRGAESSAAEVTRALPPDSPPIAVNALLVPTESATADMAFIRADSFTVGIHPTAPRYKTRRVWSEDFYVDRHEVTNGEYMAFLDAMDYDAPPIWNDLRPPGWDRLPVVGVSLDRAREYAEWRGKRLLTRLEWERVARGHDGAAFPWWDGHVPAESLSTVACVDRLPRDDAAPTTYGEYLTHACAVGSHSRDRTPEGVFDLLGSVAEWVDSPASSAESDSSALSFDFQCVKGADWARNPPLIEVVGVTNAPTHGSIGMTTIGFRCGRSVFSRR